MLPEDRTVFDEVATARVDNSLFSVHAFLARSKWFRIFGLAGTDWRLVLMCHGFI